MTDKLDGNIPCAGAAGMEMHRPGGVRDAIRAARLYEQLGYVATGYSDQMQSWIFRSIWSPELIPTAAQVPDYEACYNTIPLLAAVASHTEKILLSTIVDCYRRSPSILAQELLTLDHISHGRVMIAIGTGENKQFLPYGLERAEPRNAHLEEAIRIIKTLMRTTQPVTEPDNRFWQLHEGLVALPPHTTPPPRRSFCLRAAPRARCGSLGASQTASSPICPADTPTRSRVGKPISRRCGAKPSAATATPSRWSSHRA